MTAHLGKKVLEFISEHSLIPRGSDILLGVSGGADSVCLVHLLAQYQRELGIHLHMVHVNHLLRGAEAEADALYVISLGERLGLPVIVERCDVVTYQQREGLSLEEAARELRYRCFAEVARRTGTDKVAVAHIQDDQVETILLHLLRGSGTTGLLGLKPRQISRWAGMELGILRPLLDITREETSSYCRRHRLAPRSDSSNLSLSLLRNRIRLELLPLLRTYNPNIDQALLRLAALAQDELAFIEAETAKAWERLVRQEAGAVRINKEGFGSLPLAIQRHLLRESVSQLLGSSRDIESKHIEAMRGLAAKPVGRKLKLPHSVTFSTGYGELALACREEEPPFPLIEGEFPIEVPGETILPGWRVTASIANRVIECGEGFIADLDLDKAGRTLFVRGRRPGDRFHPLGLSQPKKLQDFMVDAQIPRSWRDRVPLLCSPAQVLWVVGFRPDDRVKITGVTRDVLHIEFERLG